jgi:DNA polymerase III delta subunit
MLYVIYGTDTHKARAKLHDLLDLAKKKRPEAELFKLTTENWSEGQFDELLVAQGLFEQKYTTVLDNLFEKKDIKSYVMERLEGMKESEQIFLMLESSIDAASLKKLAKFSEKVQVFEKVENKKPSLNIFSITDGLVQKDKKKLWISYVDLLGNGAVAEEIHGILFWQVKNMILASRAGSATETGLSPFVYKNALTGARNYKNEDLQKMSSDLVDMTHRVRQGKGDLEVMMEKWVLGL